MSDLVVVEKSSIMTVFTEKSGLDPILEKIATEARSVVGDVSTAKGRDAVRSIAYKVAQSKTYLDGLGKDLVAEMKELPKKVDEHRRMAREFLEALQAEVRQPLTDWEAEQERIEAEKKAAAEAEALALKIETDHEIGLLLNAEFDRQAQAKKEAEIQAAKDRDAQIAREAAERATREAEEKAAKEKQEAEAREVALRVKAELAEQERLAAIEVAEKAKIAAEEQAARAEQDRLAAIESAEKAKIAAEEKAKRDAAEAVEAERRRVQQAEEAEAKERAAREANRAHKSRINSAAVAALIEHAGLSEEQGKSVVAAIYHEKVPAVRINY